MLRRQKLATIARMIRVGRYRSIPLALSALGALSLVSSSFAAEPTEKEVAAWIKELDDDDFERREAAEKILAQNGASHLKFLQTQSERKDLPPETAVRLGRILLRMNAPAPGSREDIVRQLKDVEAQLAGFEARERGGVPPTGAQLAVLKQSMEALQRGGDQAGGARQVHEPDELARHVGLAGEAGTDVQHVHGGKPVKPGDYFIRRANYREWAEQLCPDGTWHQISNDYFSTVSVSIALRTVIAKVAGESDQAWYIGSPPASTSITRCPEIGSGTVPLTPDGK